MEQSAAVPQHLRCRENGPIVIDLPAGSVVRLDGRELVLARPGLALCRCGGSADKPLCDGSHKRQGFAGPAVRIAIETGTGTGLDEAG